jgi:hypothetical protein
MDVNLEIKADENVNETAAVKVLRPMKSGIEIADNEERFASHDDAIEKVS